MTDPMKKFIDFLPLPKKMGETNPGERVAVWNGQQDQFLGMGTYLGNEYYHSHQFGAGTYPKIELDTPYHDRKIIYGCECWWQPLDMIPAGVREKLGITG
jgi:hypothetical protein